MAATLEAMLEELKAVEEQIASSQENNRSCEDLLEKRKTLVEQTTRLRKSLSENSNILKG